MAELPWCIVSEGEYVPVIVIGKLNAFEGTVYVIVQAPVESSVHEGELNEPPAAPSSNAIFPGGILDESN